MTRIAHHRVAIVGGGVAGSALAIALAQRGIKAVIIERDPAWTPLSSGIFVYGNGLHALDQLGVLGDICEKGWVSPDGGNDYLTADGATITRTVYPRGGHAIPAIVGIRRVDLHRVLASRVRELGVEVLLGETVASIDDGSPSKPLTITLSGGRQVACEALIGADGIRSQIRDYLFGAIEPVYAGLGVWRSTHVKPASVNAKIMMMGVGTRLGIMPISSGELYLFGTTREPGKPHYPRDSWAREMRAKFSAFGEPASRFLGEISRPEQVFFTAIEEVQLPLPWNRGRIGLIGDAAHSSSPFMGQGGAMALEDGVLLAALLDRDADVAATLLEFGARRYARCRFVQEASRQVGQAGATEDVSSSVARNDRMRERAQQDVDMFYARLADLKGISECEPEARRNQIRGATAPVSL